MSKNQNHIRIDPERCKGCGVCVNGCPRECISIGSTLNKMGYTAAQFEQKGCVACGVCFYSCPEFGAISVYKAQRDPAKETHT